ETPGSADKSANPRVKVWSRHSDLNRGPAVYECERSPSVEGSRGLPRQFRGASNPLLASTCYLGISPQGSAQGSGEVTASGAPLGCWSGPLLAQTEGRADPMAEQDRRPRRRPAE